MKGDLNIAGQLVSATISYTESKGVHLHDKLKAGLLEMKELRNVIVAILAEAEALQIDNINEWDQQVRDVMPHMQEIDALDAELDPTSLGTNKALVVTSQIVSQLYMECRLLHSLMKQQMSDSIALDVLQENFERLVKVNLEVFLSRIVKPEWKTGILFALKCPDVVNVVREKVIEKLLAIMPAFYRATLAKTIKEEGLAVALQQLGNQMPELLGSGAISQEDHQKKNLIILLENSVLEDAELAELASKNLPVMAEAFSEEKLGAFLSAGTESGISINDLHLYMPAAGDGPIKRHIETFINPLKQKLRKESELEYSAPRFGR